MSQLLLDGLVLGVGALTMLTLLALALWVRYLSRGEHARDTRGSRR